MNQQSLLASSLSVGVAIGAGLASALLFIVSAKGSLLALALAYFAPLPLMIASLGFGQWTGLVGALLGSGLVATLLYPMVGLIYAVGIGVPAWFVCVAALRGAPPAEPQPTRPARAKTIAPAVPNPSPMRALAIATLYFAVAISVGALLLAAAHGGLTSALGKLADELAPLIRDVKGATTSLPEGLDPDRLARRHRPDHGSGDGRVRTASRYGEPLACRAHRADFRTPADDMAGHSL